jgi:hypothetical protein
MDLFELTLVTEPEPLETEIVEPIVESVAPRDSSASVKLSSPKTFKVADLLLIMVFVKGQAMLGVNEILSNKFPTVTACKPEIAEKANLVVVCPDGTL